MTDEQQEKKSAPPERPAPKRPRKRDWHTLQKQKIMQTICERIAEGVSLTEVCLADGMPVKTTVLRWLARDPDFQEEYSRARAVQIESFPDHILEIADERVNDTGVKVARSRLRVDSRKWLMVKLAPKKYGDRHRPEPSGPADGPVAVTRIELVAPDDDREG